MPPLPPLEPRAEAAVRAEPAVREPPRPPRTLAVVIDHIDHFGGGYESELRVGFEAACEEHDLNLLVVVGRSLDEPDPTARSHNALYELLSEHSADGVIFASASLTTFSGPRGIERLCARYAGLALCSLGLEVPGVPSLVVNGAAAMTALVEHLIRDHHRSRIAFISGPLQNPDSMSRLLSYQQTLARHGLELDERRVEIGNFMPPSGKQAMHALLDGPLRCDAVVAANDGMAHGALQALAERGLSAPRDLLITGFDDLPFARQLEPPLTTVRQPLTEMARAAVRLVADQLAGKSVPMLSEITPELVIRASCGCDLRAALSRPPEQAARRGHAAYLRENAARIGARVAGGLASRRSWVERALAALCLEIEGEDGALVRALERQYAELGTTRERYEELAEVVSDLWSEVAPVCPELGDVFVRARESVASAHNRVLSWRIAEMERSYRDLLRSGEQLSRVLDFATLKRVLEEALPGMGIRNACISLYVDDTRRQLVPFFWLRDGAIPDAVPAPFEANLLVPTHARPRGRHRSFVLSLRSDDRQLGVAVLEFGDASTGHEMLRDQIGAAFATVALHREIVHKTQLHERSVQERAATAERMSSLSVLAGGVAHDLNNTLGPLLALPDVIDEELRGLAGGSDHLAEVSIDLATIKSATQRAAQTIQDLLTLGRQGKTRREALELSRIVAACLTTLPTPLQQGESREIVLELGTEPLVILGAEQQLARAVLNLIKNAFDATESGGRVVVRTSRLRLPAALPGYEAVPAGDYALLSVADDGAGMARQDLARVFEPFFSRKKLGESSGSGLGLAIVHGVVKEHQGFVDVESEVGRGTTFTLYFPRSDASLPQPRDPSAVPRGSGKILVVDDDLFQRRAATRVLTQLGYEVTTYASGERAYDSMVEAKSSGKFAARGPYDLVIMDVVLNERRDGLELLESMAALFPEQRAIVASGHAPTELGARAAALGLAWLAKPYTVDMLARAVRSALA